jgi:uncharacterized membrane protein
MASLIIPLLSLAGLLVSAYLLYGQKAHKRLVCLIGHDCDEVVKSAYGRTFGFENTILGVLFYGGLLAISLLSIQVPPVPVLSVALLASVFSVYLIYVQAVVLRKWCDYCVLSALLNWGILAVLLLGL